MPSTAFALVYDVQKESGDEQGLRFATTWPPLRTAFLYPLRYGGGCITVKMDSAKRE